MEIKEIQAKSILSPSNIPGIDFVINPYTGCAFACKYCYASFMCRYLNRPISEWGSFVYVKTNAIELLKKELPKKLKEAKGEGKEIFLSSVTDPYQGAEAKYKLTRQCLETLAAYGYEGQVSILTKSKLVTRDIDVLKQAKNVSVGLTVTSTNDGISRYFETYAPPVSDRFEALKQLNQYGIKTYAFIGPLLPHFIANRQELEKIFEKLVDVGTTELYIEHLNLTSYIRSRLMQEMQNADKEIIATFYSSQSKQYRESLNNQLRELVEKYSMKLLTPEVIYHTEHQRQNKHS